MSNDKKFILWLMLIIILTGLMSFFIGMVIGFYYQTKNLPSDSEKFSDCFYEQPKIPYHHTTYILGTLVGKETITATITAYSSTLEETDATPFITASGEKVRQGIIACPYYLEFGTIVKIDEIEYICEDRVSLKYPNRFDIWFPDRQLALQFGKRTLPIIIYE